MPNNQPVVLRMRISRLENHSELPEIQRNRENIVDRHHNARHFMDQFWLRAMGESDKRWDDVLEGLNGGGAMLLRTEAYEFFRVGRGALDSLSNAPRQPPL